MRSIVRSAPDGRTPTTTAVVQRLLPALLAAALLVSLSAAPVGAVRAPTAPEAHLLGLINNARQNVGRVPLLWDNRLADIAQERADSIAAAGVLTHISTAEMSALYSAHNIVWHWRAEVLTGTAPQPLMESAGHALLSWQSSPVHWNLLMESEFNYMSLAVAKGPDGWLFWTGLLLKGPDRTPPKASMTGAQMGKAVSGKRSATVSWSGTDVPLSVMTAGLKDFRLQRRVGSKSWVFVTDWTKATSKAFSLTVGKTYRFRVRARDMNGNKSTWTVPVTVKP
jgi:uncharacterized protein YkwD